MSFSDPKNEGMIGNIVLGETGGQAVQVVVYYPGAHGRDFLADARVILKNLHFKSDKLPIGKVLMQMLPATRYWPRGPCTLA